MEDKQGKYLVEVELNDVRSLHNDMAVSKTNYIVLGDIIYAVRLRPNDRGGYDLHVWDSAFGHKGKKDGWSVTGISFNTVLQELLNIIPTLSHFKDSNETIIYKDEILPEEPDNSRSSSI